MILVLNAVLALRIVLFNASPKGRLDLISGKAVSVVVTAIPSVLWEP
jgi:hypothetical protein